MKDELLTPIEVARWIRSTTRALSTARCLRRDTPKWIKIGRKVLYRSSDVRDWLDRHAVQPRADQSLNKEARDGD